MKNCSIEYKKHLRDSIGISALGAMKLSEQYESATQEAIKQLYPGVENLSEMAGTALGQVEGIRGSEMMQLNDQAKLLADSFSSSLAFSSIETERQYMEKTLSSVIGSSAISEFQSLGGVTALEADKHLKLAAESISCLSELPSLPHQSALGYISHDLLSSQTQQALLGIGTESSFQQTLRSFVLPSSIEGILDTWDDEMNFIGRFEVDDVHFSEEEQPDNDGDDQKIILPEDIESRLIEVKFLPLKLIKTILQNPEEMRQVSPREFEKFVAYILDSLGFEDVCITSASNDGGRDIIATQRFHGIPMICAFECKQYREDRPVGVSLMRTLLGTISHHETQANKGVLVTTSHFTKGSKDLILSNAMIDGKDFNDIVKWVETIKGSG